MPGGWARALRNHSVTLPGGVAFGPGALADGAVFGQYNSAAGSGIGQLDPSTGRLTRLWSYGPAAGGMGAMSVDFPWLVWEQLDSQTNLSDWSIHAWNLATHTGSVLATSELGNGRYVPGQQPLPVVRNAVAAWAQPVPVSSRYVQAQIRVADLSTHRVSVLDSGRVSSPVYAGPYLIWGKINSNGQYLFRAVDAGTLKPVILPAPLRHPGSIGYLAGSPQYLAWSTQNLTDLMIWPGGSRHPVETIPSDSRHHFQFLQLAGHFVLWYNGTTSSVLDLRTGNGFDVRGEVTGSPNAIVIAEPVGQPKAKGSFVKSRISTLAMTAASSIGVCG